MKKLTNLKPIAFKGHDDKNNFNLYLYPLISILSYDKIKSNYQNWFNDPDITRFNSHGVFPFSPLDDVDNYLHDKSRIVWGIISMTPDDKPQHISNISLQEIDLINRSAEISCIIGEVDYWSKGIMTWALPHLIRHGFQSLGLNRIYAGTAKVNAGMIKVFQKLGFAIEGEHKESMYLNGRYESIIPFGLLRSAWKKQIKDSMEQKIKEQKECASPMPPPIFHQEDVFKVIDKVIDKIEQIRTENNRSWMDLLRLAVKVDKEKAKVILRDIIAHDKDITAQLEKIVGEE
jgi:RimJ/RimL family protein N-acetyltransferase